MVKIIKTISANPRKIFQIDGLGAILSAFLLGVILTTFEDFFGMPARVLYILAGIAAGFALYSLTYYFLNIKKWHAALRRIAIANLLYCLLTLTLVIIHFQELTVWGILYFALEILVIITLVYIEFRVISYKNP
ncbi:MAG: hypothetical protein DWQ02_12830 [Bacteroidetes bacterium]|nr:MAG: hypothetical protein DWQ02_12830 [Bacteroidota bacterium]